MVTLSKFEQPIVNDIVDIVNKAGGHFDLFYVGITRDPSRSLFIKHKVSEINGIYNYYRIPNYEVAYRIKEYCIRTLGMDGLMGVDGFESTHVYIFMKTPDTSPGYGKGEEGDR